MDDAIYLTKEGYKELKDKLAHLKGVVRVEISEEIERARAFGDISENAEYDAAREREAQVEQEIFQIENTLRDAKIIGKVKQDSTKVGVGSTVVVEDVDSKETMTLTIMGGFEADPLIGHISNASPMGKALVGSKKGDVVDVVTPNRVMKLKVKNIKTA